MAKAHVQALVGRCRSEAGAGIVEYLLLIVAIALVVLVVVRVMESPPADLLNDVADALRNGD